MKPLIDSLQLIVIRRDSRFVIIVAAAVFFLSLLMTLNGSAAVAAFSLSSLSFMKQLSLFSDTLFDIQSSFSPGVLRLGILGSVLGGINLSLAYTYFKIRGESIMKSGLYSGVGLILAFLGIGCAACGTAFLSIILGLFGLSTILSMLPYQGEEIGYLGLLVLCIATYSLSRKVTAPNVC
jgi:hypothetical protein